MADDAVVTAHAPFPDLSAHRVLVAEDDPHVALLWDTVLRECGSTVLGPHATVHAALECARTTPPTMGLLDVELMDSSSGPIAEFLEAHGIPFLCVSTRSRHELNCALRRAPHLAKPVSLTKMLSALTALVA